MVVMQLISIVLETSIESFVATEGEPDFEFISRGDLPLFLSESLLKGDGGGGGFTGGFEGEELFVDEVVLEDRPLALLEGCPGFRLKGVCFGHQQIQ